MCCMHLQTYRHTHTRCTLRTNLIPFRQIQRTLCIILRKHFNACTIHPMHIIGTLARALSLSLSLACVRCISFHIHSWINKLLSIELELYHDLCQSAALDKMYKKWNACMHADKHPFTSSFMLLHGAPFASSNCQAPATVTQPTLELAAVDDVAVPHSTACHSCIFAIQKLYENSYRLIIVRISAGVCCRCNTDFRKLSVCYILKIKRVRVYSPKAFRKRNQIAVVRTIDVANSTFHWWGCSQLLIRTPYIVHTRFIHCTGSSTPPTRSPIIFMLRAHRKSFRHFLLCSCRQKIARQISYGTLRAVQQAIEPATSARESSLSYGISHFAIDNTRFSERCGRKGHTLPHTCTLESRN